MKDQYNFEFIEHPSDIKIRSYGYDLAEVFINAALGMMKYIYGRIPTKADTNQQIEIHGENLEILLVEWLSKILSLSSINHCAYIDFDIQTLDSNKLIAVIGSKKIKAQNEIKAVTYHDLSLERIGNQWVATILYDI